MKRNCARLGAEKVMTIRVVKKRGFVHECGSVHAMK